MYMEDFMQIEKKELYTWISIIIIGIFFFFYLGDKGTILCKDSPQYLQYTNFNSVMPTYPLFISLTKIIFGETLYIQSIYIIQGIFALIISIIVVRTLQKIFILKPYELILVFIFTLLPYAYTLPEHVSSHEIMTESLTFPLFYLFFLSILKCVIYKKMKNMICGSLVLVVLIALRSQLLFLLLIYISIIIYLFISVSKQNNKLYLLMRKSLFIMLFVLLLIGIIFATRRNVAKKNSDDNASQLVNAFLGKTLYVMKEEDVYFFESEELREIYQQIFWRIDEKQQRLPYSKKGLLKWEDISYCSNDNMKIGIDELYKYYRDKNSKLSYKEILKLSEIAKTKIVKTLLIHNIDNMIKIYLYMLPSGFISMVFIQKRNIYTLCTLYAIFFYLVYIVLLCYSYKKRMKDEIIIGNLVFSISIFNVLTTNLIHYGLQRYFVYTFGLLYISTYLLVRKIWYNIKFNILY